MSTSVGQAERCRAVWCRALAEPNSFGCTAHPSPMDRLAEGVRNPSYDFQCSMCGRDGEINGTKDIHLSDEDAAAVRPSQCAVCSGRMMLIKVSR